MEDNEDEPVAKDPTAGAFSMIAYGFLAAIFWLPYFGPDGGMELQRHGHVFYWVNADAAINFLGYLLLYQGLGKIREMNPRFELARTIIIVAAFFGLIDAVSGPGLALNRPGFHGVLPATLRLRDYALGAAIWMFAWGLIDLAEAKKNVSLRNAAGSRRDLYLMLIVVEGLIMGPFMFMVSNRALGGSAMSLIVGCALVFKIVVAFLWMGICQRAAKGFEPDPDDI